MQNNSVNAPGTHVKEQAAAKTIGIHILEQYTEANKIVSYI